MPLRLRHAGPAAQLSVRSVRPTNQIFRVCTPPMKLRPEVSVRLGVGTSRRPSLLGWRHDD
jgi:hypothetical protein